MTWAINGYSSVWSPNKSSWQFMIAAKQHLRQKSCANFGAVVDGSHPVKSDASMQLLTVLQHPLFGC